MNEPDKSDESESHAPRKTPPTIKECNLSKQYSASVLQAANAVLHHTYMHPDREETKIELRCYWPLAWLPSCRAEQIVAVVDILDKLGLLKAAIPEKTKPL